MKNELEKKWGVDGSSHPIVQYNENDVPHDFKILIPYVNFYCISDQSYREDFLKNIPLFCFKELEKVLLSFNSNFITYWLANDENYSNSFWSALSMLVQINGEFNVESPDNLAEDERKEQLNTFDEMLKGLKDDYGLE
jgi:hypothetical protein